MFSNLKKRKIIPRLFDHAWVLCVILDENGKRLKTDKTREFGKFDCIKLDSGTF